MQDKLAGLRRLLIPFQAFTDYYLVFIETAKHSAFITGEIGLGKLYFL